MLLIFLEEVSLGRLLTEERDNQRKQKCSKRELLQKIRGRQQGKDKNGFGKAK